VDSERRDCKAGECQRQIGEEVPGEVVMTWCEGLFRDG
jgi:hypothetical protein